MRRDCTSRTNLLAFKNCINGEWFEFYSKKIGKSAAEYYEMWSKKRSFWAFFLTNPFKQYQKEAVMLLSTASYGAVSDSGVVTKKDQQIQCGISHGYMLRASGRSDHKMRTKLSHKVRLDDYFKIEFTLNADDFRNKFFATVQSTTANKKTTDLDALDHMTIWRNCKTVLAVMCKRLIIGLKEQIAAARAIVQGQFDDKAYQEIGLLLTAWAKLVKEIEALGEDGGAVAVTRPEKEILAKKREDILLYFHELLNNYLDNILKVARNIYDDLILFNYVLLQQIDVGIYIDLDTRY